MKSWENGRSHRQTRKNRRGIRRTGILWVYNGDGRFKGERYTASDNRYWKRWTRREGKRETEDCVANA